VTKFAIDADGPSVTIELTKVAGPRDELLEAFGECQAGRCSCPTEEYEKVAEMGVQPAGDQIAITLEAQPGTKLDPAAISACLEYTVGKSGR
jgi:hypothetical protein